MAKIFLWGGGLQGVLVAVSFLCGCGGGIDPHKLRPDSGPVSGCRPLPDGGCPGLPGVPVAACASPQGAWTLVAPHAARYQELRIERAREGQAAATLDWDEQAGKDDLAGFVLTRPALADDPLEEALGAVTTLARGKVFRRVSLISSGSIRRSHEGTPLAAAVMLEIHQESASALYRVRNPLFPLLLEVDLDQLLQLPSSPTEIGDAFVLSFSTLLRPSAPALFVGGVASKDSFLSQVGKTRIRAADLTGGTLLGGEEAAPRARCGSGSFSDLGRADVIWLVDGGTSMNAERIKLHQAAVALWNRARSLSLDLRVAVARMELPDAPPTFCAAKACPGPFFPLTEGGLSCFQECLLDPGAGLPTAAGTCGMTSARRALLALLPRAAADPRRLRPGAQVALIFASNAEDCGVSALFDGEAVAFPPRPTERMNLDRHLQPMLDLLAGRSNPDLHLPAGISPAALAGTAAYALVPYPLSGSSPADPAGCVVQRGTGYCRLVQLAGGSFSNLCLEDLDLVLELILEDIASRASALDGVMVLDGLPVAASLSVSLNGESLFRSLNRGFDFAGGTGSILLNGLGTSLVERNSYEVGYFSW